MKGEHDSQPITEDAPNLAVIKELTGVELKIESVPGSDWEDKQSIALATGDFPDVISVEIGDAREYGPVGTLANLSEKSHLTPNMLDFFERRVPYANKILVDGSLYYFPKVFRQRNIYGKVPIIRTDILDELDLPFPDSFDELYDTLKAMKEAYPESYPWTSRGTNSLLEAASYSMGSFTNIYYDEDVDGGTYKYGPAMPEFRDSLEFFTKLYAEGLVDPDFSLNGTSAMLENMSSGKSFMYYDNGSFAANVNLVLKSDDPNSKVGTFPIMKNSKGERRNLFYIEQEIYMGYGVNADSKNLDRVIEFMDWMYTEEAADLTNFGIEGVHYEKKGDEYVIMPELVDKYLQESDPWRSFMSSINAGDLGVCVNMDERSSWPFIDEDMKAMYDHWANEPARREEVLDPPFTKEELERLSKLRTDIHTIYEQNVEKVLIGEISLEDYDDAVSQMMEAGVEELEKIYNDADARLK